MRKSLLSATFALALGLPATAQLSLVNPVPQQQERIAETLLPAPEAWNVKYDKTRAGSFALGVLSELSPKAEAKAPFTLTIGVKGDKSVKKYAKKIPARAEGYYLSVTAKGIVIAGADEQGLFYGLQTLRGMMAEGKIELCDVRDWPDVRFRGVVEGFYGTPWSHEARKRQFDFYGHNKMNVYIYGPKDDPYHRDHWRDAYPEEEAQRIKELAEYAHRRGVNFYWAIHPGIDIKWTEADRDALVSKFERMYALGVRSFAVFFDDIWGEGTRADKQAELLNYVDDNFIKKHHDVSPLVMCPTEYNRAWANDEKGYLRTLGTKMNKGVEIMWTGNSVVHCIDKESMEWINSRIDRKAYIWWNFPVTDFCRDHLAMGPAYGNGLDIAEDVSGFVSNPMEHAEASKLSLYGIADYTWNMKNYDDKANWEKAIRNLLPDNAVALRAFAVVNEDLGPNGHGFRRDESRELKPLMEAAIQSPEAKTLSPIGRYSDNLSTAADLLLADRSNPALIRELRPWLLQAKNIGEYGQAVVRLVEAGTRAQETGALETFEARYRQARSLREQMYQLENSAVRHPLQPGCKVGSLVLLPGLDRLFADAVKKYNTAKGTTLDPIAEYQPYRLSATVPQLSRQPISAKGSEVIISPSNEVITWPVDSHILIEMEQPVNLQGLEFNFGVADQAKNFRLEVMVDGQWKNVSLLHYKEGEQVVHTGNELAGMNAQKIRLTNSSGKELKVYFRKFHFTKQ